MQRKRGELVPIGEVVSGLDDVPALRDASPQATDVTFKKAQRVKYDPSEKQKILPIEGEPSEE